MINNGSFKGSLVIYLKNLGGYIGGIYLNFRLVKNSEK